MTHLGSAAAIFVTKVEPSCAISKSPATASARHAEVSFQQPTSTSADVTDASSCGWRRIASVFHADAQSELAAINEVYRDRRANRDTWIYENRFWDQTVELETPEGS